MDSDSEVRFIADNMLGRLARWLRILGYDVLQVEPGPDKHLIALAKAEDRVLLTRDKTVAETKHAEVLYILNDNLDGQLRQVAEKYSLKLNSELEERSDGSLKNRCGLCNGVLMSLPPEEARPQVPEGVARGIEQFWQCEGCKKIYWEGSHWRQISERLNKILNSKH